MKRKIIVVSGILAATISLPVMAQGYVPDWFSIKHPEVRKMDEMRDQAAGANGHTLAVSQQQTAAADTGSQVDWAELKHPELETMEQMRDHQAAQGNVTMHGAMAHHISNASAVQSSRS